MSSSSLERKENHYSNDAVEKSNENCEEHGNCTWVKFTKKCNLNANDRQEVKLGSQRRRLRMEMKARRMVFPTHYFTLLSEEVEIVLILPQKVIQSRFLDHDLTQTPELDVQWPSPFQYQSCSARKATIRSVKAMKSMNKK